MRAKRGLTTTVILCLLLLVPVPPLAKMAPVQTEPSAKLGEILVKFRPGVADERVRATLAPHGARTVDEIPHIGVKRVSVPPGREWPTIEALLSDPHVEYAERNYIAYALPITPNDPDYGSQWALPKIQAPEAWDIITGTSDIVIAIVDTGVDLDHPDLEGKIVAGRDFVHGDDTAQDDHSHGTHVAGIAAAKTNNGLGIAGVSWGAKIMPLKVLDDRGDGTYYDVAQGVYYAVDKGAAIINLSLAGLAPSSVLEDAVNYAHHSGVLVVAAAGNCALGPPGQPCNGEVNPDMYPAAYDNTVAVAATDSSDNTASFSEHRAYVDVAAPGVDILSTVWDDNYGYKTGTSMAAPHVAGLAALVWSYCPNLTNDQVRYLIEWSADDLGSPGWDEYYGQGRINADHALSGHFIIIRDAPAGGGAEVLDYTMTTDETFTAYAAGYDCDGNYIGDLPVDWATTGTLTDQTGAGPSLAFDPTTPGRGTIMANDGHGHAETGTITVEWPFKRFFPLVHN